MSSSWLGRHRQALFLATAACALLPFGGKFAAPVQAQQATALEGIVITSPSPILDGVGGVQQPNQPYGTLIVADDAFAPVTVATEQDVLASQGSNIADALDQRPGITGTTFAPGSNRPIIRGLDTYRVRIQENGIGSHDVSALSEDHAVPIDPFAAEKIEVIRGPATLRYGGRAIGGVVSVENNRIPTFMPRNGFSGQVKGAWSSVDEGREGAFRATAGAQGVVVHADGSRRRTDDYETPNGTQFNSFVEADSVAYGLSLVGSQGFIGVSVSRYSSFYGITGGEEAEEKVPRIDLEQNKLNARGEWRVGGVAVEAVRFWFGATEYGHNEVVMEDEGDEIGQRFTNTQYEGRLEVQHTPFVTGLGRLRGAVGTSWVDRNTRAQSFEGDSLLQPAETDSIAAYVFEELDVAPGTTIQAAGRVEHTDVSGTARLDPLNAAAPLVGIDRDYTPISGSLGVLFDLPAGTVLSATGTYAERAPDAAELFSAGIHEATETFEIGNPDLDIEGSFTAELGLRRASGAFRFDATAFYTRFDGFIFKGLTGEQCGEDINSCGIEDELDQVLFAQRDATFHGVELAGQYDVAPIWNGVWGVEGQYDFVRAKFDGGGNVPRIPPHRLGGGLFYKDANWFARAGVLHAFDQDDFANEFEEVATPGYTLVSAEVSYTTKLPGSAGVEPEITLGVKGENLADEEVLNHASFKRRQEVLLPGASVRVFGSLKLN